MGRKKRKTMKTVPSWLSRSLRTSGHSKIKSTIADSLMSTWKREPCEIKVSYLTDFKMCYVCLTALLGSKDHQIHTESPGCPRTKSGGQLWQYSQTPFCSPDKKGILIAQSQIPPLLSLEPHFPLWKPLNIKSTVLVQYRRSEYSKLSWSSELFSSGELMRALSCF